MCGFTGIVGDHSGFRPEEALLDRMGRTLFHRGPDDGRVAVGPGGGVAFRRLSIIDLEGGRQPFVFDGGRRIAAVNGEIYNHKELRAWCEERGAVFRTDSDCEVVPHLYALEGPRFVERLVGMFAFCVLDLSGERPQLLLGRDRLGIKPMYWARVGSEVRFGSEPKAILEAGGVERQLRPEALLEYLMQGYVGGSEAAWTGMQRLPAGSLLHFEGGREPRVERYWAPPLEAREEPLGDHELLDWLDRVVADRLIADVPLGAFLSGGVDSTAVVDSMARTLADPVVACSVGFRERSHDELDQARASASRLHAVHHTEVLEPDPTRAFSELPWLFDEPHADPSDLPTYLVSGMARRHVTVALSGDGGDEVFAGYRRYVHDLAENRLRARLGPLGTALAGRIGAVYPRLDRAPRPLRGKTFLENLARDPALAYYRSVTQLSREDALELLAPDVARRLAEHDPFEAFAEHYRRPRGVDSVYRAQYADLMTYLPDQILAKTDRASMGVSLEVRVPLLDHRFVERFAGLPTSQKISGARGKHCFREALRERIGPEVLDATKRGFDTPLADWFRGPLASLARESLESLPADWLRVDRLRERLDEHLRGRRDHGRLLWSLCMLEAWRQRHEVRALGA